MENKKELLETQEILDRIDNLEKYIAKDSKKEDKTAKPKSTQHKQTRTKKYAKLRKELEKDSTTKRTYTKYNIDIQGDSLKTTKYVNKLMEKQLFSVVPIQLNENGGDVIVSTKDGEFALNNNDIYLDTLISNIVENNKDELKEKGYIERTLLNIANEFYYPQTAKHWEEKQLQDIFNLLYKNMTPLLFVYGDGSERLAPLINIEIDKKSRDATATIRINANQYIKEYNDKAKGKTITIYKPNLKALGLSYTLADSELVETLCNDYILKKKNIIYYEDLSEFRNKESRTEKDRYKKKVRKALNGLSTQYHFRVTKEDIKKSRENVGIKIIYKNLF